MNETGRQDAGVRHTYPKRTAQRAPSDVGVGEMFNMVPRRECLELQTAIRKLVSWGQQSVELQEQSRSMTFGISGNSALLVLYGVQVTLVSSRFSCKTPLQESSLLIIVAKTEEIRPDFQEIRYHPQVFPSLADIAVSTRQVQILDGLANVHFRWWQNQRLHHGFRRRLRRPTYCEL